MKIAWFTPFYYKSAIGRYSKYAAEEISKHEDIVIYTHHNEQLHKTFVNVKHFDSLNVIEELKDYDVCIYNIGDYSDYHALIFDVSQKHSGIIISHDVCLHNFMRAYFIVYKENLNGYIDLLGELYGKHAAEMILNAGNSAEEWGKLNLAKYSMSENAFQNALGVVVHSKYHQSHIREYYPGKSKVIPLIDLNELGELKEGVNFNGYDKDKINILTVGNVNPNKRIEDMIKALGEHKSYSAKFHYSIIGSLADTVYVQKLRDLISSLNLEQNVKLLGFVEDDELAYYYHEADLISNLRYPAYEGGSASLVEQMILGKSIVVSNTGVYAELPDNTVFKTDIGSEVEQISELLDRIASDPGMLKETGENAKEFATHHFSREHYAQEMLDFIHNILFLEPFRKTLLAVNIELSLLEPSSKMIPYLEHLTDEVHQLFSYHEG